VDEEKEDKDAPKTRRNEILKEIETGDEELSEYTRGVVDKVLRANMETLLSQNIKYDFLNLESNIISENLLDKSESLLKGSHLLREAKLEETKGCMVLEMDGKEIVYSRQNGTRLYVAKDIAYALWKHGIIEKKIHWSAFGKNYDDTDIFISDVLGVEKNLGRFEGSITVVDVRQDDEQKVVANTVKILSEDSDYTHYSYGVVNISHNTAEKMGINTADKSIGMSGRRGYVIEVDQMISKIESKLKTEAVERKEEIDDDRAAKLSSNIIKYELLKTSPVKTITFDIDESTKLKGDTALYINYTYARAVNILKKAQGHKPAELRELEADEGALVKNLLFWEEKVKDAVANLKANVACEYVHEVADSFNVFYEKAKVLGSDRENERLAIVSLVEYVMRRLMDLIGLFKVERI
jgi:arginyl-tRNA synthetase